MENFVNEEFLAACEERGERIRVVGSEPIILSDSDDVVWFVLTGQLDLFHVNIEDGQIVGGRTHTFSLPVGSMVMGLPGSDGPFGLIAVGHPDTEAIQISWSALQELCRNEHFLAVVASFLDGWVEELARAVARKLPPKRSIELFPSLEQRLTPGDFVFGGKQVSWVSLAPKDSSYLGFNFSDSDVDQWVLPLTRHAWARPNVDGTLTAISTQEVLAAKFAGNDLLAHFNTIAQVLLNIKTTSYADDLKSSVERTREADARSLSSTLQALAVLDPSSEKGGVEAFVNDPIIVQACRHILADLEEVFPEVSFTAEELENVDLLPKICTAARIRRRFVILKNDWWNHNHGPLLAYLNVGDTAHPVALLSGDHSGYRCINPANETIQSVDEEMAESIQPKAIQFYRPFPLGSLSPVALLKFASIGNGRDFSAVAFIGAFSGLLGVIVPLATGQVFDRVIPEAAHSMLWQIVAAMLAVAFGQTLFSIAQTIAMVRIEIKMNRSVQSAIWDKLLSLPASFYRDYSSGDLALRAQGIDQMRRLLAGVVMGSVLTGIFSIWYFLLLFYYSIILALWATGLVLVAIVVSAWATYYQTRYQRIIVDYNGKLASMLLQFINGISKLRVSGTEERAFRVWGRLFAKKRRAQMTAGEIENNFAVFHGVFPLVSAVVLFWFVGSGIGAESAMDDPSDPAAMAAAMSSMMFSTQLSVGQFLAFYASFGAFVAAMLSLVHSVLTAVEVVPIWERARPIMEAEPEIIPNGIIPDDLSGNIELNHVCFRYSESAPIVLHDINIEVEPGQFVALVGPSGSGKSSLFRLMVGLEQATAGAVYYDGQPLSQMDLRFVRRQVGVVLQNTQVIRGTLLSNIIGSKKLPIEDAWHAAKMACLDADIKRMPMGMHTIMTQGGSSLSGGQRQRLLIARALVHNPRILFFDEATSALDNKTQAEVSASIEALNTTRIVVAHRLTTIRNADKIVVLKKGRIVEQGKYDELMALNGTFASLAKRQLA